MSRLVSTFMRSTIMRIHNIQWIAVAIISLFTHTAMAQSHQDLAAVISGGNNELSEAVYGLQSTAYASASGIEIAGDGPVHVMKFKAQDYASLNFADAALNQINTVVIRFNDENLLNNAYDGSLLATLENLSTVVLLCTIDAPVNQVSSIAMNNLPVGVNSYYVISIPE